MRGVYEATIILTSRDLDDPQRRAQTVRIWETAHRLEESEMFRRPPRRRINAKLDDHVAEMLAEKCRQFGVTQDAALGLITTPWPTQDEPEYRRYRRENLDRIVELARQLEFTRRPYAVV